MAIVLKPPQGRLVPAGPVKIDGSHPLAYGMSDCIVRNTGGDPINLAVNQGGEVTQNGGTGTPTQVMTAEGPAGYATGGSAYSSPYRYNMAAGDLTMRVRVRPITIGGAFTPVHI